MSKVYQEGGEQDSEGAKLRFFSFLISSEIGLDFEYLCMLVEEATKNSWDKKTRVWCEQSEQKRERIAGVSG